MFCVFMPFQLYVAQQIIRHENLNNCILIEGYRENFGKTYDLMCIDSFWNKRIPFDNLAKFTREDLPFIQGNIEAWRNYKWLKKVLQENDVDAIYLGEATNQGIRFIAKIFGSQGYKIIYFEEGSSHYSFVPYPSDKRMKTLLKIGVMDAFYYYPLFNTTFANWRYNTRKSFDGLPIYRRYSIIPNYHHKSFDRVLPVSPMISSQMAEYIKETLSDCPQEGNLFMTEPLERFGEKRYEIYKKTINEILPTLPKDKWILIKFHHRDTEKERKILTEALEGKGVKYKILAAKINIPVEYYLQSCHFDKVFFFNASTYFYNGIIYPRVTFLCLLPVLYRNALKMGVSEETKRWMEKIMDIRKQFEILQKNEKETDLDNI